MINYRGFNGVVDSIYHDDREIECNDIKCITISDYIAAGGHIGWLSLKYGTPLPTIDDVEYDINQIYTTFRYEYLDYSLTPYDAIASSDEKDKSRLVTLAVLIMDKPKVRMNDNGLVTLRTTKFMITDLVFTPAYFNDNNFGSYIDRLCRRSNLNCRDLNKMINTMHQLYFDSWGITKYTDDFDHNLMITPTIRIKGLSDLSYSNEDLMKYVSGDDSPLLGYVSRTYEFNKLLSTPIIRDIDGLNEFIGLCRLGDVDEVIESFVINLSDLIYYTNNESKVKAALDKLYKVLDTAKYGHNLLILDNLAYLKYVDARYLIRFSNCSIFTNHNYLNDEIDGISNISRYIEIPDEYMMDYIASLNNRYNKVPRYHIKGLGTNNIMKIINKVGTRFLDIQCMSPSTIDTIIRRLATDDKLDLLIGTKLLSSNYKILFDPDIKSSISNPCKLVLSLKYNNLFRYYKDKISQLLSPTQLEELELICKLFG